MFILWPYSMGNAIAGECCGDAFHSWMEVLSWQMGLFPRKFGSKLKQCIPLIEFKGFS
jgi:hypothetical protein